ncbi:hypothetical protein PROFUN_16135 [Planoprotostelium fungivorum]|uniref:Uncharacterized protein n=1 Tax=Planoprotostelium fungivorum TaxID=1890364 RepID=A0A2P6MT38_9EUKA|nr:hypothetical protein PROFUN_16135 [Planoprotostelium fungivorum]
MNKTRWQDSFKTDIEKPLPLEFQQSFSDVDPKICFLLLKKLKRKQRGKRTKKIGTCGLASYLSSPYKFEVSLSSGDRLRFLCCTEREQDDSEP